MLVVNMLRSMLEGWRLLLLCMAVKICAAQTNGSSSSNSSSLAGALYKNSHASVEDRVADLLPRMTLEEKIGQLMQGNSDF